jgi:predicted O-methyltransferase YrrM
MRLSYRAHLADRADLLLALRDDADFRSAWSDISPVLTWNHRPSARRLWQLARLSSAGTIVEIGSYEGNSTVYLAMAGGEVHAVDPHTPRSMKQLAGVFGASADKPEQGLAATVDPSESFLRNLDKFGVREQVIYHRASSVEVARAWAGEPVRLLYVDGMHTYDAVQQDYEAWRPLLAEEHVVLFDDYLWAEVQHAVDDLRPNAASRFFYVRGGQAIFSTTPLPIRVIGLP